MDQYQNNTQLNQLPQLINAMGGADGMKRFMEIMEKAGADYGKAIVDAVASARADGSMVAGAESSGGDPAGSGANSAVAGGTGKVVGESEDLIDVGGIALASEGSRGSSASGRSSATWSDIMDEQDAEDAKKEKKAGFFSGSGGGLVMPKGRPTVRAPAPVGFVQEDESAKFFANYVRVPEVRALRNALAAWGVSVPKSHLEELALARYTQATVPSGFVRGKDRLKALAKVGDNVLTLLLTDELYYESVLVGDIQSRCASVLCGAALSQMCYASGLSKFVSFPAGIDVASSRPAGEALEAIVGVMYHSRGLEGVRVFMRRIGLLKS